MQTWERPHLVALTSGNESAAGKGGMLESGIYHQSSCTGNYSHFGVVS